MLFADVVGFTARSAGNAPQGLVRLLDLIFSEFAALAGEHGLEKTKMIGDAYEAEAGLTAPHAKHAIAAARIGKSHARRRCPHRHGNR